MCALRPPSPARACAVIRSGRGRGSARLAERWLQRLLWGRGGEWDMGRGGLWTRAGVQRYAGQCFKGWNHRPVAHLSVMMRSAVSCLDRLPSCGLPTLCNRLGHLALLRSQGSRCWLPSDTAPRMSSFRMETETSRAEGPLLLPSGRTNLRHAHARLARKTPAWPLPCLTTESPTRASSRPLFC